MKLSKSLKEAREQKKLTQNEVAEQLYVSRQAVSRWETGKTVPDVETLKRLSVMYEVSMEELVKGNTEKTEKNSIGWIKDKELLLLVILMLASSFTCYLGVPMSLLGMFIVFGKKKKEYSVITKGMILATMVVNLFNFMVVMNEILFHVGKATIQ